MHLIFRMSELLNDKYKDKQQFNEIQIRIGTFCLGIYTFIWFVVGATTYLNNSMHSATFKIS